MGFFDWVFERRYTNEREWLTALQRHTDSWYNELTGPLSGLLVDFQLNRHTLDAGKYIRIAEQLVELKIRAGSGSDLENTMSQMGKRGILFFTNRETLREKTKQFLDSGYFIKDFGVQLHDWKRMDSTKRQNVTETIYKAWKKFQENRDELIEEVNKQLQRLG